MSKNKTKENKKIFKNFILTYVPFIPCKNLIELKNIYNYKMSKNKTKENKKIFKNFILTYVPFIPYKNLIELKKISNDSELVNKVCQKINEFYFKNIQNKEQYNYSLCIIDLNRKLTNFINTRKDWLIAQYSMDIIEKTQKKYLREYILCIMLKNNVLPYDLIRHFSKYI